MFHLCRLVHADLSEYNLLYYKKQLYVIDVSQSVEHDHPHALEFLRKDCTNVVDYFKSVANNDENLVVMGLIDLFEFVVKDVDSLIDEYNHNCPPCSVEARKSLNKCIQTHKSNDELDNFLDLYLEMAHEKIIKRGGAGYFDSDKYKSDVVVFQNTFIPRTLDDLVDVEKEVATNADESNQVSSFDLPLFYCYTFLVHLQISSRITFNQNPGRR